MSEIFGLLKHASNEETNEKILSFWQFKDLIENLTGRPAPKLDDLLIKDEPVPTRSAEEIKRDFEELIKKARGLNG